MRPPGNSLQMIIWSCKLPPPTELERMSRLDSETMEAAQIFVSMLPVLPSYPFFQRYFTKGLVLGGVKG